jgi:hypothetical protein
MTQSSKEWGLLTAVVTASNQQNFEALYVILSAPENDFSDKPRCVMAAMMGIELIAEHVKQHRDALISFASHIANVDMSLQTSIRYEILKELLQNKADLNQ